MKQDFHIGNSLVQSRLNVIQSHGKTTRVKPRSMAVLMYLASAEGEVVPKKELIDAVWGQSVVTEDVLTQSIVELRKAFHDSAGHPKVIETIRRVGFRLLQPVTSADTPPGSASFFAELVRRRVLSVAAAYFIVGWLLIEIASVMFPTFEAPTWTLKVFSLIVVLGFPLALVFVWAFELTPNGIQRDRDHSPVHKVSRPAMLAAATAVLLLVGGATAYVLDIRLPGTTIANVDPSVAVLPFVNLSDEPESDYFSDGLSEEVLNTLARIPGLRVPARTSSFAFRGRDEDIRVIGNSLNVATVLEGSVRRSGQQIRVSAQLIDASTGYQIWTQTYDRQLADVFAVQIEIAGSIVDALSVQLGHEGEPQLMAGTADTDAYQLYLLGRHNLENELGDWIGNARQAFNQAIVADPLFARAYAGLADTYLIYRETPAALMRVDSTPFEEALMLAAQAVEKALELDPALADAYISRAAVAAARSDLAAEEEDLRRAIEINPSLVRAWLGLGMNLVAQHRPAEALDARHKAAALDPLNPQAAASLANLTAALGDYETAVSYPLRLLDSGLRSPLTFEALVDINRAYGRFDERVRWGRELVRLAPTRTAGLAELADAYLELGEFDLAEQWVRRADDLSPIQAFKIKARLYAVRNDIVGITRLAEAALQGNPPQAGMRLTPAQSSIQAIAGISYLMNGKDDQAVDAFSRVFAESPTLNRRSPELPLFAVNWLVFSHVRAGNDEAADELLVTASSMAQDALDNGYGQYPPLVWEMSLVHTLSGRDEEGIQARQDAVARGWRHYYLQGREFYPMQNVVADSAGFDEIMRVVQSDVDTMRQSVRDNGWAETPDEFFGRDRVTVSGAR